jgi:hypothetical protein
VKDFFNKASTLYPKQNQEVLLLECEEYVPFDLICSISTQKFVEPIRAKKWNCL